MRNHIDEIVKGWQNDTTKQDQCKNCLEDCPLAGHNRKAILTEIAADIEEFLAGLI